MLTTLFDIGNVLLAFDFSPALKSLAGPNAVADAEQRIIARKDCFEAGQENADEYIKWASQLLDFKGSREQFETAWTGIFTPIVPMWELAQSLKQKGHRLILFSNTNCLHAPYCMAQYPILSLFDHAVFSHEIGCIKPDDSFYQKAIKKFHLIPEQTLYVDDLEANIQTGNDFGFTSFLYDQERHQEFLLAFEAELARRQKARTSL